MVGLAVLVLTNELDVGADFLIDELTSRSVEVVRINTERFPDALAEVRPGESWRIEYEGRSLCHTEASGVWWRRPEPPPRTNDATVPEWEAVVEQWRAFSNGLASVRGPVWISNPHAVRAAEDKATQLTQARAAGFRTPETIWTNDLGAATTFVEGHAGTVVKSVTTAYWETPDGASYFVFATEADAERLPTARALSGAPVAFQKKIEAKVDIRVTVVSDRTFAACCVDPTPPSVDWRLSSTASWTPHRLPGAISQASIALTRSLGLQYAGIDLVLDGEGVYWFLEANPNGEWGWLQHAGLPIADALANALT